MQALRALVASIAMVACGAAGCSVLTSLDGLTNGDVRDASAPIDVGPEAGGAETGEAGAEIAFASCAAAKAARPNGPSGLYLINPDDASPPFRAYCDMVQDDGGWMLVTPDMIASEGSASVTVTKSTGDNGGLVLRAYANGNGCGSPQLDDVHLVTFTDRPAWTKVRARHVFAGGTACWWIFGQVDPATVAYVGGKPADPRLIPFDKAVDVIRGEVRMGGSAGAAFDGRTTVCDNQLTNFWHYNNGPAERSAVVILRRRLVAGPAGLATATSCTDNGPGTTSPTWWEYSEIYVR